MAAMIVAAGVLAGGCTSLLPKLYVGVALAGLVPEDSETKMDIPLQGDVFARVDMAILEVEASYGIKTYQYEYSTGGGLTETGDLEAHPLALAAKLAIGPPQVHLLIGFGMVFDDFKSDDAQSLDSKDASTYRIIAGAEMKFSDFSFVAEGMYDLVDDTLTIDPLDPAASDVDVNLSGLMARVAIAYNF